MTAPFSSEDFVRRSLFSSIFGSKLRVRTPRYGVDNEQGTSRGSLGFANDTSAFNPTNANTAPSSSTCLTTSTTPDHNVLCNQLEHNLYLASPQPQEHDICTPEAIYKQIVHECSEFEQRSNGYNDQASLDQITPSVHELGVHSHRQPFCEAVQPTPVLTQQPVSPATVCVNCQHHFSPTSPLPLNGHVGETRGVSVEEIVKMVLAAVKDVPLLKSNDAAESPEEVLRRKRQQNNEAALRYRRRQKEARIHAQNELDDAMHRNEALRAEVAQLQVEIDALRQTITDNGVKFSPRPSSQV